MLPIDVKIARLQGTLRRLEDDFPLLAVRVRDLSPEGRESAKRFATTMIQQAQMELKKLQLQAAELAEDDFSCEPAD